MSADVHRSTVGRLRPGVRLCTAPRGPWAGVPVLISRGHVRAVVAVAVDTRTGETALRFSDGTTVVGLRSTDPVLVVAPAPRWRCHRVDLDAVTSPNVRRRVSARNPGRP